MALSIAKSSAHVDLNKSGDVHLYGGPFTMALGPAMLLWLAISLLLWLAIWRGAVLVAGWLGGWGLGWGWPG